MKRYVFWTLIVAALIVVAIGGTVQASAMWEPVQLPLTAGAYVDTAGGVSVFVWNGQVHLYDPQTEATTQISNTGWYASRPQTDGKYVVWQGTEQRFEDDEIYLYDIAKGSTTKVTDNSWGDISPVVSNGRVAWMGYPDGTYPHGVPEIYIYSVSSGLITRVTSDNQVDANLDLDGDFIVWDKRPVSGADYEIYAYDCVEGATHLLSSDPSYERHAKINGALVAWSRGHSPWDICVFDLKSMRMLTVLDSGGDDVGFLLSGRRVAYLAAFDGPVEQRQVFVYDARTRKNTPLTDRSSQLRALQAFGGRYAFCDFFDQGFLAHDVITGQISTVTEQTAYRGASARDGVVIWESAQEAGWRVGWAEYPNKKGHGPAW